MTTALEPFRFTHFITVQPEDIDAPRLRQDARAARDGAVLLSGVLCSARTDLVRVARQL